jgi:nucleoside-diphosphate kinase
VDRTFVIVKPDAVSRGLVGEIIARLEDKQLRVVAAEMRTINRATAEQHYAEHVGKPFYDALVAFITGGPALLVVVEGPDDTWQIVRALMGATDPTQAQPGTIRGDLAITTKENLIHGSDSRESVEREIKIFFPDLV